MVESPRLLDKRLRRITENAKSGAQFEREIPVSKLRIREIVKACDAATAESYGPLREIRALEARVRMLCDALDRPKCRELTNWDVEVTTLKMTDAQG